jgi:hypothetical protein
MKTIAVPTLVLALAVAAGCVRPAPEAPAAAEEAVVADDPKPPAAGKDVPPAIAELVKERNALHKRQTGALLTITAKWEKDPRTEAGIVIDWQIAYDGPRRPFTVLTPRLDFSEPVGQTTAHFWYPGPDGKPAGFKIAAGGPTIWLPPKQKAWFSVAADGKLVAGKISAGGGRHLKRFSGRDLRPGEPRLWVQLGHAPTDRGDGFEWAVNPDTDRVEQGPPWTLDAWTGELWSQVVEVAVK